MPPTEDAATGLRLDIWLWAARFFKTRSLAKQAIGGGKIDLDGDACKPSRRLHGGERLEIRRGEERIEVEVLALSAQRNPASIAQSLYRETEASHKRRETQRQLQRLAGPTAPRQRPSKQDRRKLLALKQADGG